MTYVSRGDSRGSWESEQLRPVTSIAASWEEYSLHADEHGYEPPEHNLLVAEADDPELNSKLVNAIVHGKVMAVIEIQTKISHMYYVVSSFCFRQNKFSRIRINFSKFVPFHAFLQI